MQRWFSGYPSLSTIFPVVILILSKDVFVPINHLSNQVLNEPCLAMWQVSMIKPEKTYWVQKSYRPLAWH